MNNLNQNQYGYYNKNYSSNNDERMAGGFIFPFLLGGVTGAAIAPAFYNNNNRPVYYYQPYPYPYYPYYPRRFF